MKNDSEDESGDVGDPKNRINLAGESRQSEKVKGVPNLSNSWILEDMHAY